VSTASERQWELYFDDSAAAAWMTGGTPGTGIVINFGLTGSDFIQLTRSGATLGISIYVGGVTLPSSGSYPCTFTNTLQWNLTVEIKNGYLNIYQAWDPAQGYGGYIEPIFCQRIAYAGGLNVNSCYSPGLMNANMREGIYIQNMPSIQNSLFWNTEGADQGYGGSGYNHPSHWAGGFVYRDVIEAQNFYTYVYPYDFREQQLVPASGISLTTDTNAVIISMSLPAGTWEISGTMAYVGAGAVNVSYLKQGSSANTVFFAGLGSFSQIAGQGLIPIDPIYDLPLYRITLASTTTVGILARAGFTVGTLKAYGYMRAERVV
jgi:hypothetical protein